MKTWKQLLLSTWIVSSSAFAEKENKTISRIYGIFSKNIREDHKTEHEHVFTPEQETAFRTRIIRNKAAASEFKFSQTDWNECAFNPSGNYSGAPCARARQISVKLQDYLADFIYECVDAGLRSQGGGVADDVHIEHDGILGDRNHSPRSLHAEARAIDIKAIKVALVGGGSKYFKYAGTTNREFYKAFRSCWGRVVNRENGCPIYQGNVARTGTIGWENADHKNHLHTSVPYCVNGRYGAYYYQR